MIGKAGPAAAIVAYPSISKQDRYTCICCRIKLDSAESQRAHFKTEWHLYNIKRRICSLDPFDLEGFKKIQEAAPKITRQDDEVSIMSESGFVHIPKSNESNDDDWELVGDELLDEDYCDDEIDELLSRIIEPNICLFCDKKSSSIRSSLEHMDLVHGFFIPEEKYMIDLEGMMEYIGFKVGAGTTCLWCQKQFTTLKGVRHHMIIKDHCKILYDQEKATEEFKEFYDYSTQDKFEMKPITELVIIKKRPERRFDNNRSMFRSRYYSEPSGSLIAGGDQVQPSDSCQSKANKRFDSYRAKILLRTSNSNNQTMRSRMRQQNPK